MAEPPVSVVTPLGASNNGDLACSPSGERATSPPLCRLTYLTSFYVDFDVRLVVCDSNVVLVVKFASLLCFFLGDDGCYAGSMICSSVAGSTGDKHSRLSNKRPCTELDSKPSHLFATLPLQFPDLLLH